MLDGTKLRRRHIVRSRARCTKCGDIIESKYRHNFVECKCGAIFLDGGHDYVRVGGKPGDFVLMTEYEDDETGEREEIGNEQIFNNDKED